MLCVTALAWVGCTSNASSPGPPPTTGTTVAVLAGTFVPTSATWISPARGWVLGSGPALLRTVDGGAHWAALSAPPTGAGARSVRFADERNGWLYGPELWATHDGGSSWRRIDSLPSPTMRLEVAEGRAYTVAGGSVYATDAGSDAWRSAGGDQVDPYAGMAGGYVVGGDGAVRALSAAGLERRGTPCPNAGTALAVAGADVVAVCQQGSALGSATKSLVVSSDGARTWTDAGMPPRAGSVAAVAGPSSSTVVVAASSGGAWLYRSEDGGRTWATAYTGRPGGEQFDDLAFTDATHGAVVAGGRLLLTADAGRTWSAATF
ncbi:MAG TPA: YCF48-related protein [Acidimicrobiales bacterium]|nr:YCF48-related protein [Acidimicrobiales bacterium]